MRLLNINKMLLFIYITTFIIQKQQIISLLKKFDISQTYINKSNKKYILNFTNNCYFCGVL